MISPVWLDLDAQGPPGPGGMHTMDAGAAAAGGRVLAGLDGTGLRHLLVPLAEGAHVEADRRSAGVHLAERELEADGVRIRFADLACRRPHLAAAFALLGDEATEEIRASPDDVGGAIGRVLGRWRELLDREASPVLSLEQLIGLFGELWVLRRLLAEEQAALRRWTGPLGGRHDFTGVGLSLEIKSTLRREGRVIEVHGLEQMEAPPSGRLFLTLLRLEQSEGGESVPDLVAAVAAVAHDHLELERRLAAAGYDRHYEAQYQEVRFLVLERTSWKVDEGFPRIVRSSFVGGAMPAGTLALRYRIDLSGPAPAPLAEADEAAVFTGLAAAGG